MLYNFEEVLHIFVDELNDGLPVILWNIFGLT